MFFTIEFLLFIGIEPGPRSSPFNFVVPHSKGHARFTFHNTAILAHSSLELFAKRDQGNSGF